MTTIEMVPPVEVTDDEEKEDDFDADKYCHVFRGASVAVCGARVSMDNAISAGAPHALSNPCVGCDRPRCPRCAEVLLR